MALSISGLAILCAGLYFYRMTAGRPTKYDPTYCDAIIEAGREGKSWTAFAASIEVSRATINVWMSAHPEFLEAANVSKALAASWYEEQQRNLVQKGGTSAQATLIVFGMKNMGGEDWRDKVVQELVGKDDGPIEVSHARDRIAGRLAKLTPEQPLVGGPKESD